MADFSDQLQLNFGRGDTPPGVFGDFMSDLIYGSNLQPQMVETFLAHFAHSWFDSVSTAYGEKSLGLADELGNSWKPLSNRTKAYNRPDIRLGLGLSGPKRRPTLTPFQDRKWRSIFSAELHRLQDSGPGRSFLQERQRAFQFLVEIEDERAAMSKAASYAWNQVKLRYGAHTLMGLLKDAPARIMIRTSRLADSLTPPTLEPSVPFQPRENQVFRRGPNLLVLGTSVEYAAEQHKTRPLWPSNYGPWVKRALAAGFDGIKRELRA